MSGRRVSYFSLVLRHGDGVFSGFPFPGLKKIKNKKGRRRGAGAGAEVVMMEVDVVGFCGVAAKGFLRLFRPGTAAFAPSVLTPSRCNLEPLFGAAPFNGWVDL